MQLSIWIYGDRKLKQVDTREYVSVLKGLVEEGKEVGMVIWGSSMTPFLIHNRDKIYFAAPDRPLRRGDMVFYQRASGQYVMHRICKVKQDGYYMVGDAQTQLEGPIGETQIFAGITKVERKGKVLTPGSFWWRFFAGPWLVLRPVRPLILRAYALIWRIVGEK